MLKQVYELMPLLARDSVDLRILRNAGQAHKHRDHGMTRKIIERVLKVPVGIFLKITQDARVELLFIQRRLQVDGQTVAVLREVTHMRTCRQDQRAGDTEMREEHLAEVGIDLLIVLIIDRERHVAQGKALHLGAPRVIGFQRHERGAQRRDRVAELLRKAIAVSGRAGERVRHAAGADNGCIAVNRALRGHDGGNCAVARQNIGRSGVQNAPPCVRIGALKRIGNVVRAVGDRKHAVAALSLERHAEGFKQRHRVARLEAVERAVEKASVAGDVCEHGLDIAIIRHVAAALAGDAQLLAEHLVRLKQHDAQPALRRCERTHGPGRTAADHDYISFQRFHTPRILSRRSPAPGRSRTCAYGRAR